MKPMSEEPISLEDSKIVIVTPMEQDTTQSNAAVTTVASVTIKRKTVQNDRQFCCKWCTVLASVAALVGGFAIVLAFSHILVVPHLETEDFVQTDCYIRQIDFHSVERDCSPTDCHASVCRPLPVARARTQPEQYELCAKVMVRYYSLEGRLELAVLNPELQTDPTDARNVTQKCGCGFFDIRQQKNQSENYFNEDIISENSIEDDGQLSVVASGRILQAKSKTRCYYRRKNIKPQVSFWYANRHVVLHAILWPTVIFVLGFVGLFFSCLTLQKEKYSKKKPPKACVV